MKKIVTLAMVAFLAGPAWAGGRTISGSSWFGCKSRSTFERLTSIAVSGDSEAFGKALLGAALTGECIPFKAGTTVYTEDTAIFSGLIKVRPEGEVSGYWTNIEAVR